MATIDHVPTKTRTRQTQVSYRCLSAQGIQSKEPDGCPFHGSHRTLIWIVFRLVHGRKAVALVPGGRLIRSVAGLPIRQGHRPFAQRLTAGRTAYHLSISESVQLFGIWIMDGRGSRADPADLSTAGSDVLSGLGLSWPVCRCGG